MKIAEIVLGMFPCFESTGITGLGRFNFVERFRPWNFF